MSKVSEVCRCPVCDSEFQRFRRDKVFCSKNCGRRHRYGVLNASRFVGSERRIRCRACDVIFVAKNPNTRYCTQECRRATHRLSPSRRNRNQSQKEIEKKRESWLSKTPEQLAARNKQKRAIFAVVVGTVSQYKLEHGCADCGYNEHPAALQFDHVRGQKTGNIGSVSCMADLAWFWMEVKKCEVVCARCHAIRTHNRRRSNGAE